MSERSSAFRYAHASGGNATSLVADCLGQIGAVADNANLGFLYATDSLAHSLDDILLALKASTGIEQWTGTVGIGICATGVEYYDQPALAIMLGEFLEDSLFDVPLLTDDVSDFVESSRSWLSQDVFHFGIVHADPTQSKAPELLDTLSNEVPGAFLVGGFASSSSRNALVANDVVDGGLAGVLFRSDIAVATGHSQGCEPIAAQHTITACQHNVIVEIDERPALDVFKEDIGEVLAKEIERVAGYIFAALPIRGSDTGDYLVRNLVGIDREQGLIAIGDTVEPGDSIMFCRRDGNSAREDMQRMLDDIADRLPGEPRGAIYYSCLARGRHQFGDNAEELRMIEDKFAGMPLVGFFANGEIFHNRLYAYTGVLSVFY
ncbi:MAG: FIST N-terminal domain-containing protein [Pseudomonadota bacterium]